MQSSSEVWPGRPGPQLHLVVSDSTQVRAPRHGGGHITINNFRFLITALMNICFTLYILLTHPIAREERQDRRKNIREKNIKIKSDINERIEE